MDEVETVGQVLGCPNGGGLPVRVAGRRQTDDAVHRQGLGGLSQDSKVHEWRVVLQEQMLI